MIPAQSIQLRRQTPQLHPRVFQTLLNHPEGIRKHILRGVVYPELLIDQGPGDLRSQ